MSTWKQCKCRVDVLDSDGNPVLDKDGKKKRRELGTKCPDLWRADGKSYNPSHGSWYAKVELPGEPITEPDGSVRIVNGKVATKRKTAKRGGFEKEEYAKAWIKEAEGKVGKGIDPSRRLTVAEYLTEWIESKGDIKQATAASYRQHIRAVWIPAIGQYELTNLRKAHVAAALDAQTCGPASKQRIRATLRNALNDAKREGLVEINVAELVKIPSGKSPNARVWTADREVAFWMEYETRLAAVRDRAPNASAFKVWYRNDLRPSPVMVWTAEQVGRFLDAAADHRLYALFHLIAFRGLRRGEACGVRRADLDLELGRLAVGWQISKAGGVITEGATKTDASDATIALDSGTVQVLRDHLARQAEQRAYVGSAWTETPYVFTAEDGSPLDPLTVTTEFELIAFAAGLPPIRLHDLRHVAASLMHQAGVDMKTISSTLRHGTVHMTQDLYTSVFEDVDAAAAEMTAAIVPRATDGPRTVPPTGSDAVTAEGQ